MLSVLLVPSFSVRGHGGVRVGPERPAFAPCRGGGVRGRYAALSRSGNAAGGVQSPRRGRDGAVVGTRRAPNDDPTDSCVAEAFAIRERPKPHSASTPKRPLAACAPPVETAPSPFNASPRA